MVNTATTMLYVLTLGLSWTILGYLNREINGVFAILTSGSAEPDVKNHGRI